MTTATKFEDTIGACEEAYRKHRANLRAWLAEQKPEPTSTEDIEFLERRYVIAHPEEINALEELGAAAKVARAALDRRWIEAHEDLAVLRKARILQ